MLRKSYTSHYINQKASSPRFFKLSLGNIILALSIGIFTLSLTTNVFFSTFHLYINTTTSLPKGLYKALPFNSTQQKLVHNELVLTCLEDEIAEIADERGYILRGKCSDGSAPIGKHVLALAGDNVVISAQGIKVNGELIQNTAPSLFDSQGRPLPRFSLNRILLEDEVLLANPVADSFDGRYFGPTKIPKISSILKPILTF